MKFTFKQQLVFYFFLFGFIVALMSSLLIFNINKDTQLTKYITKASFKFKEREDFILSEIHRYELFLSSIVNDEIVKESLNKNQKVDIKTLNKALLARAKGARDIFRLRLIDNNGMDISSIKKDKHNTMLFPLQNKSSRYYVKETNDLEKGKVWFSKIDLNYEFGIMERPLQPTLRIVYAVYIEDKKQGIIIINIDMTRILEKLSKTTTYHIYLVDKDGDFILFNTKDANYSWSKYLKNKKTLKDIYPKSYKDILNNEKFIGEKFYSSKIDFNNDEDIKMILHIKESLLGLNSEHLISTMLKGLFITIFLSIPFVYFVSRGLNKIKKNYEKELININNNLKKSNQELMLKTIEFANESMKVNHLNRTLEKRVKEAVSKNKLQNKQMLQQSRLAQMGEMISMIAHQWRQPLTAISATTNNLIFKLMMDDIDKKEFEKEINLISDYSQHLSKTIDDFRGFFKENKNKELISLSKIVKDTIDIVKTSIENKNIILITNIGCTSEFKTYPSEIKQVILNLIQNAEDILLENNIQKPQITIETICGEKCANPTLIIKDNGGGIPSNIIDKIFDPYFSTKKAKNGTGLGLFMSKTIIEEHCNGKIEVENDNNGAVFKISFNIKENKGLL